MSNEDEINEEEHRFQKLARYSRMPQDTFNEMRLERFVPLAGKKQAHEAALKYVGQKDGQPLREHHFLTFAGEVGRGKTHLLFGIGWHFLANNMGIVLYWRVSKLLDAMRDWLRAQDHLQRFERLPINPLEAAEMATLLLIDDLGTERPTEWAVEKLEDLVDDRWLNKKLTVFTTNAPADELSPRVRSRIKEGVTVIVKGIDYREFKAQSRKGGV